MKKRTVVGSVLLFFLHVGLCEAKALLTFGNVLVHLNNHTGRPVVVVWDVDRYDLNGTFKGRIVPEKDDQRITVLPHTQGKLSTYFYTGLIADTYEDLPVNIRAEDSRVEFLLKNEQRRSTFDVEHGYATWDVSIIEKNN